MKSKIKPLVEARISGPATAALAIVIVLCGCVAAHATSIIYTISGVGSGSFGANSFSNASFTITSTADTSQITGSGGILTVPDLSATVFVSGIGSGTFSDPMNNFDNNGNVAGLPSVGITDSIQFADVVDVRSEDAQTYDLSTSIGPLTLSGAPLLNPGRLFPTTAGNFSFTSVSVANFQATTVPEPSLPALSALAAAFALFRRRK